MSPANQDESQLEIPALGRNVSLGYLYNERTDQFYTFSIFKRDIPSSVVDLRQNPSSSIEYVLTNTYEEKFRLYKIDASIAANILSGQLTVEGSAHYLKEENQSAHDVTGILKYEEHTFIEDLQTHKDECLGIYNMDLLKHKGATHIVTGIEWGGVVAVQFTDKVDKTEEKQEIAGKLKIEFEKLKGTMSISGQGSLDMNSTDKEEKTSFKLSVRGDVSLPSKVPSNYQQVQELIQQVPELIKGTNNGKGVPLKFHLLPIPELKKHLQPQIRENDFATKIQEGLLTGFVNIFDEIAEVEQRLNDVFNQLHNNEACVHEKERNKIGYLRDNFKISKINFSTIMRETLVKVRSGEPEALLRTICNDYKEHEFSHVKVGLELDSFRDALNKVEMYQTIRRKYPEIKYFGRKNDLESALLESIKDCVYILYMNSKYNATNSDVWGEIRKIFYETLNRPFNRLFLVDCDFQFPTSATFPTDRSVIQQVVKGIPTVNDVLAEMNQATKSYPLTLKAVGRQAKLGELYDARTDTFLDYSLLKDNYSESVVYSADQNVAETTYVSTELFQDKCEALGISSEQQFTILANMTTLTRSGRYLDKQSNVLLYKKSPVRSFVHTRHLTEKSVKITDPKLWNNVAFEAVHKGATHFVLKIEYGFNSIFSVEDLELREDKHNKFRSSTASSNAEVRRLEDARLQAYTASLKAVVDRYDTVTNANNDELFDQLNGNFVTTVYSDIQGQTSKPDVLRNQEELRHFVNTKFIPSLTNTNSDGVPIAYVLYPLSNLAQQVGMLSSHVYYGTLATIKGINPSVLADVLSSVNLGKAQLSQMTAYFQANRSVLTDADNEMLEKVNQELQSSLGNYEVQLQKLVCDIKSGVQNSIDLYLELVTEYQSIKFFDKDNRYIGLTQLGSIEEKIQFSKLLEANNISFLGRESSGFKFNTILAKHFYARIYFLHYHPKWTVEFKDVWCKTLSFFLGSLSKAATEGIERKFYVIYSEFGHSISNDVTGPVIQEYRKGTLTCDDVISTIIEEEVTTQTRIEELENEVRSTMREEIQSKIINLENTMDLKLDKIIKNNGMQMNELSDKLNGRISSELQSTSSQINQKINGLESKLSGRISSELQSTSSQINQKINGLESELNNKLSSGLQNTSSQINRLESNIKTELQREIQNSLRHLDDKSFKWVPWPGKDIIPINAVEGGYEGQTLYVGRAYYSGAVIPGKYLPNWSVLFIPYGGSEMRSSSFEILCAPPSMVKWVSASNGNVPGNAIKGGEDSRGGETYYIGRFKTDGQTIVGKVHPSNRCCYVPYYGKEVSSASYEVLVFE